MLILPAGKRGCSLRAAAQPYGGPCILLPEKPGDLTVNCHADYLLFCPLRNTQLSSTHECPTGQRCTQYLAEAVCWEMLRP